MSHRAHLFSLRIGNALRESCVGDSYKLHSFGKDVMAGVTVGIIAIPLAMALAIASGVAPQYGLYTAIIAGFFIALTGGSRYSISGPTAAFVVILYPIAQKYGLGGLLLATVMSGMLLVGMAFLRLGRLIEYIPEAVTLGFTGGIGVVIATLQVKDFLGLHIDHLPEHYAEKVWVLFNNIPALEWPSVLVAVITLLIMLVWPKLKTSVPPHLPALIAGSLLALALAHYGFAVDTIGSRFSYLLPDGSAGRGIPPYLPGFQWPWLQPGPDGVPLSFSWQLLRDLLPATFAIAMLGAIESLLCAVVLDGMSGKRHSANSELLGQGIGNIIAPFFGGITATAAIARSAASFKAGAQSPVAGMIHGIVVLLGLILLAPLLAYLPMPAMAALLMVVAWNMSEAHKSMHLIKTAPKSDVLVFFTCFFLTILFDMVIAITSGIILAAVLFMKDIAAMTQVTDITQDKKQVDGVVPEGWRVFKISGPLFFAAADRVFSELAFLSAEKKGIVICMGDVSMIDAGGISAMNKLIEQFQHNQMQVHICNLQLQPLKTLSRANVKPVDEVLWFDLSVKDALDVIRQEEAVAL